MTATDAASAFTACLGLLRSGRRDAAIAVQDLLQCFPNHAPGWEALGQYLGRVGQHEAALACLNRAAAVAPRAALALACGRLLRHLGRLREARSAFAQACALDPASAPAHFLAGVAAQDDRDLPAAVAAYRLALSCDPDLARASVNLGIVLQDLGDLTGAKTAYGQALRQQADTFGRVAQALPASPRGELWLDLRRLRRDLVG